MSVAGCTNCPSCAASIEPGATNCPLCHCSVAAIQPWQGSTMMKLVVLLVAVISGIAAQLFVKNLIS